MLRFYCILPLLLTSIVYAQPDQQEKLDPMAESIPTLPTQSAGEFISKESPQSVANPPETAARREGKRLIEETRIQGKLVMMKVTHDNGPVEYWTDGDGDGTFEKQPSDMDADFNLRQWKIGGW